MAWPEHRLVTAYLVVRPKDSKQRALNAIFCFLRQTWPTKQLVVVNATGKDFVTKHDSIIEVSAITAALGELKNRALEESSGEWCFPWMVNGWYDPQYIEFFMFKSATDVAAVYSQVGDNLFFGFRRSYLGNLRYDASGSEEDFLKQFEAEPLEQPPNLVHLLATVPGSNHEEPVLFKPKKRVKAPKADYPILGFEGPAKEPEGTCVVCLGRYGDIINALPIARDIWRKTGEKPAFLAAEEFVDILDGISYVKPFVYKGEYSQMPEATLAARKVFKEVIRAQIYGTLEAAPDCGEPHNKKAWGLAGYEERWNDPEMAVEFDQRDPVRERALIHQHVRKDHRPLLLIALTGGHSGPYKEGPALQKLIYADFSNSYQIVDLAAIKAERLYDMLGLYECATAMLTMDTATHHLAAAHLRLPTLVLLPDHPYYAAKPRCTHDLAIRYSVANNMAYYQIALWLQAKAKQPTVWHTFEQHQGLSAREKRAQLSWKLLWDGLGWKPLPFDEPYPRDSHAIGDKRGVPYLRDIFEAVLSKADPNDVIVFTNNDVLMLPEIHHDIMRQLSVFPATCSSRRDIRDFYAVRKQVDSVRHIHCGRDLFAFRAWWLRKMMPEIPDMIVGSNEWDNAVLNMMRREAGTVLTGQWCWEYSYTVTDAEVASPNLLHEEHEPFADKAENKLGPHNCWNHLRLIEWHRKYLPQVTFPYAEVTYRRWEDGQLTFKPWENSNV